MIVIRLLLLTILFCGMTRLVEAADSFVIGVAPHTSARVIVEMYQPLRLYLEKSLKMPVEIVTAPDFDTFARRGINQEYDLAITTGHQARLFQADAKYLPLLTYKADFKAVVLVSTEGPVQTPADIKDHQVLGLGASSLVTLWGLHWMKENRLTPAQVKHVSASDSVAQLIVSGDAAAGFTSLANYQKLPNDIRNRLKILSTSKPMAGRVYLLNSRYKSSYKKINAELWAFANTPEAIAYFTKNKLEGYRKLHHNELQEMESYANEVRKILAINPK